MGPPVPVRDLAERCGQGRGIVLGFLPALRSRDHGSGEGGWNSESTPSLAAFFRRDALERQRCRKEWADLGPNWPGAHRHPDQRNRDLRRMAEGRESRCRDQAAPWSPGRRYVRHRLADMGAPAERLDAQTHRQAAASSISDLAREVPGRRPTSSSRRRTSTAFSGKAIGAQAGNASPILSCGSTFAIR